jgi:poly(3-hydroxybutyrate) depolymerase
MIYQAYRTQANFLKQLRPLAAAAGSALRLPWPRLGQDWPLQRLAGLLETFANLTVIDRHQRSFKDMVEARAAGDQSKFKFIQADPAAK